MFAERKLRVAEEMVKKEGVIPFGNPEDTNPGIPENMLPEIPEPEVPEPPEVLEPEIPEEILPTTPKLQEDIGRVEWVTRTYKDVSSDIGATFQQPTPLNELEARIRVSAHERGHIIRAIADALVHGKRIDYAYSIIKWKVDYQHHRLYSTGGEARTRITEKLIDLMV